MQWEDDFRAYVCNLDQKKPVIICGDMNVAHQEIDLKNGAEREKDLLGLAFATRDKQEGMEAFLARRPPRFQDF